MESKSRQFFILKKQHGVKCPMCGLSHMHASIYVCDRPCNQAAMLFFTKKAKLKRKKKQFSPRCKTIPPPSVFNTFQIDFSSHVNCMKCANQRLQIDIVLRLSSSTEKKSKIYYSTHLCTQINRRLHTEYCLG